LPNRYPRSGVSDTGMERLVSTWAEGWREWAVRIDPYHKARLLEARARAL
jgi:hypothetical protein